MKNSKLLKKAIEKGMSLCHLDIETSPELAYVYALYNANVAHNQIITPFQITSMGFMFEDEDDVIVRGWDDSKEPDGHFDILRNDRDYELLKATIPIINEADIIIGQNSKDFDEKKIRWRLNILKLPQLEHLISLDILKQSRGVFAPPSHKLDYRSQAYGFGGKIHQDMNDCILVAMGDKKAQKKRMIYNAKDVNDERKVFWREVDSYKLPQTLLRTVKTFIGEEEPTFCVKCAAQRQAKFNVTKTLTKTGIRMTCRNCDHTWKISK